MIWFSRSHILRSVEKRPRRSRFEIEIIGHSKCNRLYQVFVCFHPFRRNLYLYMYIYTCFTQVATPGERKGSSVSPHLLSAASVVGKPKVRSKVANPETWWPNRLHTSQISKMLSVSSAVTHLLHHLPALPSEIELQQMLGSKNLVGAWAFLKISYAKLLYVVIDLFNVLFPG